MMTTTDKARIPSRRSSSRAGRFLAALIASCTILFATEAASSSQVFTDPFEEPTLNSFWTIADGSALPVTTFARSGNQAMEVQWPSNIQHSFGSQQTGTLSVWVLGSQLCCGASAAIEVLPHLGDPIPGQPYRWVALVVGGGQASFRQSSGGPYTVTNFPADLSQWHHLEIQVDSTGATAKFDGVIVGREPTVTSFGAVNLPVWGGGSSAPAYFDDFLVVTTPAPLASHVFSDAMENAALNPFWTIDGGSASPTTSFAHSDSQSMEVQWPSNIQHSFGSQQTGTLSVWVLGSQLCCGAAAAIEVLPYLGDPIPGEPYRWVALVVGGGQASFRQSSGGPYTVTNFPADLAQWHHLEIQVDSTGATAKFDGVIVGREPTVTSFGAVNLPVWGGGSSAPAYFDDFLAVTTPAPLASHVFSDAMENAALNPFWTIDGGSASPTTSFAHSDSQSMEVQWPSNIQHSFGSQQTGTLSVWVLGSQLCCGAAAAIEVLPYLGDTVPGEPYRWVALVVGGGQASFRQSSGGPYTVTNFPADLAQWHHLEIQVDSTGATARFDDVIVGREPTVTSFGAVNLPVWGGGSSAPAYFDDFLAVTTPAATPAVPDTMAPEVYCAAPDGLWHGANVTLACTATDAGSGLANPADASFSLTTSVATGAEDANGSTDSRTVCDTAGNCTTAGPIAGNMIDLSGPAIPISTPQALVYWLGQSVLANYSCSDSGSGVASCTGTVANGAAIDTSSLGSKTFSLTSVDHVGNTSSTSVSYAVELPTVSSIALSPTTVAGGAINSTATVTLTAPAIGTVAQRRVTLTSDNLAAATLPAHVTVPVGATGVTFNVNSLVVSSPATATISATLNAGAPASDVLTVVPLPAVASLALSPASVVGGPQGSTAMVTLNAPAVGTAAQRRVTLTSDNPAIASVPAYVTVPVGATSATFNVSSQVVVSAATAHITATLNGGIGGADLSVSPLPALASLTLDTSSVVGGSTDAIGTVALNGPAIGTAAQRRVFLTGNNTAVATVPASVVVPVGATSASFMVNTNVVNAATSVTISASANGGSAQQVLAVNPLLVLQLAISPGTVQGGAANATATVTLNAPAAGTIAQRRVTLSSTDPAAATVLATVVVPLGATSVTFLVTSHAVPTDKEVTVSATLNGLTKTTVVVVVH